MSEEHITNLGFGESIDILVWGYTLSYAVSIDMCWKRCLDDESVNLIITRETAYLGFEFLLRNSLTITIESKSHTNFSCTTFLHPDICLTRWIVSNKYNSKHGLFRYFRIGNLIFYPFEDGGGNDASVEYHRRGVWFYERNNIVERI